MSRNTLAIAAVATLFLAHAFTYLFFFVDDEAIAFVYAQNVLAGRGLSYSRHEGPVEGFSNPLTVGFAIAVLSMVQAFGWSKLSVFFVGKATSLVCGLAIVVVTMNAARRWTGSTTASIGAGVMLALAGPLAVWSCSSLETAPFALFFTVFVASLLPGSAASTRWTIAAASLVVLARVDGLLYVLAVWAAMLIVPDRRLRARATHAALVAASVCVVLRLASAWYFGEWLPLPVQTKVLYKLLPQDNLVRRDPSVSYLARFVAIYPWPLWVAMVGAGFALLGRRADLRLRVALAAAVTSLGVYAAVVGDWMFGFRFLVSLIPIAAILYAWTIAALDARSTILARAAIVAVAAMLTASGARFYRAYVTESDPITHRSSWWLRATLDPLPYFSPYYELYAELRSKVPAGTVTVNNQAGLLPFLLDLENIDDLGLGSRFFATLPTRDVIFTEVGRYHPLTNKRPLMAGLAYLLHREPRYIIAWKHLLRGANYGKAPETLLDGRYRVSVISEHQMVFERTPEPLDAFRRDAGLFLENIAHPARLAAARVNGLPVHEDALSTSLPYLRMSAGRLHAAPQALVHLTFERREPVSRVFVHHLLASNRAMVQITLRGPQGESLWQGRQSLEEERPQGMFAELPETIEPASAEILVVALDESDVHVDIEDVRMLGQPEALRAHIEKELDLK